MKSSSNSSLSPHIATFYELVLLPPFSLYFRTGRAIMEFSEGNIMRINTSIQVGRGGLFNKSASNYIHGIGLRMDEKELNALLNYA